MRTFRTLLITSTLLVAMAVPGVASSGNSWDGRSRPNGNSWDGRSRPDGNSWD